MVDLIDLDLDYCFDAIGDISLFPNKQCHEQASALLQWAFSLKAERRALMVDHHQALGFWDALGASRLKIIHIDAHHDMFATDPRVLRRPVGARGDQIGVGDFLLQALREQMLEEVEWVIPPHLNKADEAHALRRQVGDWYSRKVRISEFSHLLPRECAMLSVSISPEWIPANHLNWILETLQKLKFPDPAIAQSLHVCQDRWKQCLITPEHMHQFRYRFKYDYA